MHFKITKYKLNKSENIKRLSSHAFTCYLLATKTKLSLQVYVFTSNLHEKGQNSTQAILFPYVNLNKSSEL